MSIDTMPERVVSLVPSLTEMVVRLGMGEHLVGVTSFASPDRAIDGASLVGGFLHPDPERIKKLKPDVVLYTDLQRKMVGKLPDTIVKICLTTQSLEGSFVQMRLLGKVFHCEERAERLVKEQQEQIELIARKMAVIPQQDRQRVIRVMGKNAMLVPGDDSFQNELIHAAGGIAPHFGRNGQVIGISSEEWRSFDPQVIYSCGNFGDLDGLLSRTEWHDVAAVKNSRIFYFPCELTCRVATQTGVFAASLAADIYPQQFSDPRKYVEKERVVARRQLGAVPEWVGRVEVITSILGDFRHKTLVVNLPHGEQVLSTLEGWWSGVNRIGNHGMPPPAWGLSGDLPKLRSHVMKVLEMNNETTSLLFTGADIDNLAVVTKNYREMAVTALVTAGVAGNAVRMGGDQGLYYEPDDSGQKAKAGTINILLVTNMHLTKRAMTRAIISATEAKSGALQDLDIRSTYTGRQNGATGTGTDNILIVEGAGMTIDASGGHTRMGQLIAEAVHDGVIEAIARQNGFTQNRSVFQRLKERKISLSDICQSYPGAEDCVGTLEKRLLEPQYASFVLGALAISDSRERGLMQDLSGFQLWCEAIRIRTGGAVASGKEMSSPSSLPPVLEMAFGAVLGSQSSRLAAKKDADQ
jgi:adenosylcobinamide amidohydrolase/ABC-type Fe3+-hydroxamate transport system substrate-binding protein